MSHKKGKARLCSCLLLGVDRELILLYVHHTSGMTGAVLFFCR